MVRKTRKHSTSKVHTIPQLRRLFENIEAFVDARIQKRQANDSLIREFQKEWKRLFMKEIKKKDAVAFIESRTKPRKTLRHTRKEGGALAGAPLDYTTRSGEYLAPQAVPVNGQLQKSNMYGGGYGSYMDYINSGYKYPEMSISRDPVPGQQPWPIPYASTGSNAVKGGRRKKVSRKVRRSHGGTLAQDIGANLSQAFMHPFGSMQPPGILQDMQSMAFGSQVGASPDQVQRQVTEVHRQYTVPSLD
jgi:hypothetical protein